ncbi:DUF3857 domain-containing protein [Psychroserpens ponticola]|uniref:DUF3857 domain-containing protein n=1 Tax=Psychroserpens ponticola TaxID=2932268 RepID=A0ABY7S2M0_9FLAO|nr:DUF3857 domain-containing protein [Psychroserpens ponticola]WCO02160.1 DUF3857 domain-containing protein [Psychroserpens ponticola]
MNKELFFLRMLNKLLLLICFMFTSLPSMAQDELLLQSLSIPTELRENANAIIRLENTLIEIESYNKMVYTNKRIVTILNSSADSKHGAYMGYDKNTNIKKLEARVYNEQGKEIKKIRKSDFKDQSAVSGGTLYSDNRVKYMDYTPINYPYTVVFETKVEYRSTAFIPIWRPVDGYYTSSQNVDYKITNNSGVDLKTKVSNFEDYSIEKHSETHYSAKNLKALKYETYSPPFNSFAPIFKASLTRFDMEGVEGVNTNWKDFGKWMSDELIQDTQELPQHVIDEIKGLTANAQTDLEKAKIVYQYMQSRTRYISVQVGIGGWKPMLASDVDRLGYGDCKGLTNYTKAMLDELDVESFYTVIYGGRDIRHIDETFSSVQGNHVILCLPNESDYVWLECTSQTAPFAYNAGFTDDRNALIITPEGGEIVHTKVYKTEDNLLDTKALINVDVTGNIEAEIVSKSYGTQYGQHEETEALPVKDQMLAYKDYWNYINGLNVSGMNYSNDKDSIVFTETLKVAAERYAAKAGNRLLLQPNVFNRIESAPKRYVTRTLPFEMDRGFTDTDAYEIKIPSTFEVEALMNPVFIENKFGIYKASITQTSDDTLLYQRELIMNKGKYTKEEYDDFRQFWLEIVKYDKSKIVLKSKA